VDAAVAAQASVQYAEDISLFYSSTPNYNTTENTRQGVANDDSVQSAGQTQNGIANSQSPDAGRETQNTTLLTGARPGEGA
jgi:hypothetical protein